MSLCRTDEGSPKKNKPPEKQDILLTIKYLYNLQRKMPLFCQKNIISVSKESNIQERQQVYTQQNKLLQNKLYQ